MCPWEGAESLCMGRFVVAYGKEYGVLSAAQARERAGDECE